MILTTTHMTHETATRNLEGPAKKDKPQRCAERIIGLSGPKTAIGSGTSNYVGDVGNHPGVCIYMYM